MVTPKHRTRNAPRIVDRRKGRRDAEPLDEKEGSGRSGGHPIAHLALPQGPRLLRQLSITLLWTIPPWAYVVLTRRDRAVYGFDFARKWRPSVHYGFWGFGWQAYYLFGTGFGEEIRARGYVQSRLNEAFGRPWTIWGTQFGPGLLIASVLFGLSHLYQLGATRLDPFMMLGATLGGLFYGAVRERAGSFLGSAVAHGMNTASLEVYRHVFSGD